MSKELLFGITDGTYIYADGAKHHLYYEGTDFDVYTASNARQTIYVLLEYPRDRDMIIKFTSVDWENMDIYEISKHVKKYTSEIMEKLND